MNLKLTQEQRAAIRKLHRNCPKRRFADKLKALLLLDKGFSCEEVGDILLLDDDTVREYRSLYLSQGVESLLDDKNKGTSPYLSVAELQKSDKHIEEYVYSDSKGIIDWIEKTFSVTYTVSGINSLLKRLGFV